MGDKLSDLLNEINELKNSKRLWLSMSRNAIFCMEYALDTKDPADFSIALEEVAKLDDKNPFKALLEEALAEIDKMIISNANSNSNPTPDPQQNPDPPVVSGSDYSVMSDPTNVLGAPVTSYQVSAGQNVNIDPNFFATAPDFSTVASFNANVNVPQNAPQMPQQNPDDTLVINDIFNPKPIEIARMLETIKRLKANPDLVAPDFVLTALERALSTGDPDDIEYAFQEAIELKDDDPYKEPLVDGIDAMDQVVQRELNKKPIDMNQPFSPRGPYKTAVVGHVPQPKMPKSTDDNFDAFKARLHDLSEEEETVFKDTEGFISPEEKERELKEKLKLAKKEQRLAKKQERQQRIANLLNFKNKLIKKKQAEPDNPWVFLDGDMQDVYNAEFVASMDYGMNYGTQQDQNNGPVRGSRGYSVIFLLGLLSSLVTLGIIIYGYIYFS